MLIVSSNNGNNIFHKREETFVFTNESVCMWIPSISACSAEKFELIRPIMFFLVYLMQSKPLNCIGYYNWAKIIPVYNVNIVFLLQMPECISYQKCESLTFMFLPSFHLIIVSYHTLIYTNDETSQN